MVYQDLVKINKACESGDILKNQEIINAYSYAQKTGKKLLGLPDMKQKTIERLLKIGREDLYNGGELIEVYLDYLRTHDQEEKHLLLLHNEDDLKGMPSLLPVLFYPDFFAQDFTLDAVREAPGETDRLILSLSGDPVDRKSVV